MSGCASPSGQPVPAVLSPLDILAEELGNVAGRIEREASLRVAAALSDLRRVDAERELRFDGLERRIGERLATVKDGEPGTDGRDGKDGRDGVPGQDGERGMDGKDGRDGVDGAPGRDGLDGAIGKDGRDGIDGKDGTVGRDGVDGRDGKDGERGPEGPSGKLPLVKEWTDRVYYEAESVTLDGSTYQAIRDTGRSPPSDDWICLASAGRDGAEGRSFSIAGTYSATENYKAFSVVTLNGASFVAKVDDPGPCPGEGWKLMASQGKQGKPGERGVGLKGDRGPAGPSVVGVSVDDDGMMTLENADGSLVTCDLYPLLSRLAR